MLADLLARAQVSEELVLGSRVGVMAFHGGDLEKVTDIVAREVSAATGASYYGLIQRGDEVDHLPSTAIAPDASSTLRRFFDHVDEVVTIHGFGHPDFRYSVLLGGRNRSLAAHLASHLRPQLPGFDICDDLDEIPRRLRGVHPANPVNLPRHTGVQIELPATVRWHWEDRNWSDHGTARRAPQVDALIRGIVHGLRSWHRPES